MAIDGSRVTISDMAPDGNGNLYLLGDFWGTMTLGNNALTSNGVREVFLAKWSPGNNSFTWVQRCGGAYCQASALAVSGTSLYITGQFDGRATFGSTALNGAGGSTSNEFIAKVTDLGASSSFVWAQQVTGSFMGIKMLTDVAVNGPNVYITGAYSLNVGFGLTGNIGLAAGPNRSLTDVFVAKLVDAGSSASFVWAQKAGSNASTEFGAAIAVSGSSVYIAGTVGAGDAYFDAILVAGGGQRNNAFVAKLTDAGTTTRFDWVRRVEGAESSAAALVARGTDVFMAGNFTAAPATFGTTVLTNSSVSNDNQYVARLTDNGSTASYAWVQRAGGSVSSLLVDGTDVYLGGWVGNTADFGSIIVTGTIDVVVAKLVDLGSSTRFAWVQQAGGPSMDAAGKLALVGNTLWVSGQLTPPASFGNQTLANPANTQTGFVASLPNATTLATAPAATVASLELYPNPARTITTVHLLAVSEANTATLTLLDALGRVVYTQQVLLSARGATVEIPIAGFARGFYHLRMQAGGQQANKVLLVD